MTMDLKEQLRRALGENYFFERELGAAGMSRVFLAHEMALRRKVVVKVLPPDLGAAVNVERFRREIQFAATLQHPLSVPVLTAGAADGLPYYTMPFIDGETLGARIARVGELPVQETVQILCDVLSALAYAHERGIIHRDIKPDNILLTRDHAVVTDFGVAKALSDSTGPISGLTSIGIAIGTPPYMSPEQSAGDPAIDHRSDLYAVGAMAYQMLTGEYVFKARSPQAMLAAHAAEQPQPIAARRPAVPPALSSLIMRTLEKRPADRPQSAGEMLAELKAMTTPSGDSTLAVTRTVETKTPPPPPPSGSRRGTLVAVVLAVVLLTLASSSWYWRKRAPAASTESPSLAVLPFENLGTPGDAYFAAGMTEEISSRLGRLSGLRVIGRQSVRAYANSDKSVSQIGKELGVTYILAGSVRWDRSRAGRSLVRVSPALLRVSDGTQVWSEPSEDELKEVFQIQSKVAEKVAQALRLRLSGGDQKSLLTKPTDNLEAYDAYLRGKAALAGVRGTDQLTAVAHLERATKLDPNFGAAFAMLGFANTEAYWFLADLRPERLQMAKTAIDRALELDPDLPAAHNALGNYYYHGKLDYPRALAEFSIAESLAPNDAEAIALKSRVERRQGQWKDGIRDARKAATLDPRNMVYLYDYGFSLVLTRDYNTADSIGRRMIEVDPTSWLGYQQRVFTALLRSGDAAAALAIMRQAKAKTDPSQFGSNLSLFAWPAYRDPELLAAMRSTPPPNSLLEKLSRFQGLALSALYLNDSATMKAAADSMVSLAPPHTEETPQAQDVREFIAVARALRGEKARALELARKGTAQAVAAGDAIRLGDYLTTHGTIAALTGENDEAIATLGKALAVPSFTSRGWLRQDPIFENLRKDPRFQRLIAGN